MCLYVIVKPINPDISPRPAATYMPPNGHSNAVASQEQKKRERKEMEWARRFARAYMAMSVHCSFERENRKIEIDDTRLHEGSKKQARKCYVLATASP